MGKKRIKYNRVPQTMFLTPGQRSHNNVSEKAVEPDPMQEMKNGILEMVNKVSSNVETLVKFKFTTLAASQYIHTNDDQYFAAEIAIATATLTDGLVDQYNCIVQNYDYPPGYSVECQDHINETHCIPVAVNEEIIPRKSTDEIDTEIRRHFARHYPEDSAPVVFTRENNEFRHTRAIMERCFRVDVKVWSLDELYLRLYGAVVKPDELPTHPTWIEEDLYNNPDSLDNRKDIACDWHRKFRPERVSFCTLSLAKRWVYMTLKKLKLKEHLRINDDDGKHWPISPSASRGSAGIQDNQFEHDYYVPSTAPFTEELNGLLHSVPEEPNLGDSSEFPLLAKVTTAPSSGKKNGRRRNKNKNKKNKI